MPSKPGRYGIHYWILTDAENHYCYNAIPYLGKEGNAPPLNLGVHVVKKLVELLKRSNRNIKFDWYFASVSLFEELLKDNLTVFGIGMPNRKHLLLASLPKQAKVREIGLSTFAFKDNLTMISWHPKHTKQCCYCHLYITMRTLKRAINLK